MTLKPILCALVLAALSAAVVRAMIGRGALDIPGARSSHDTPTPRGGGLGPVAALCAGLTGGAMLLAPDPLAWRPAAGLLIACLLLAWVSHRDDVRQGDFRAKLAGQLGAAVIVVACGVVWPHPAGMVSATVAAALSIAWLVFATNAMNFIDGLNGLAAGSMLLGGLAIAWVAGPGWIGCAALALAAGLAGFLPFNYPRARIFLGDVGSQPCGFAVAALGLALAGGTWDPAGRHAALLAPFLFAGIYLDVVFTLLRRARSGERLTQAHRGHLYQLAQRSFMPAWAVSAVAFGFVGIGWGAWMLWPAHPVAATLLLLAPQAVWAALVLRRAAPLLTASRAPGRSG